MSAALALVGARSGLRVLLVGLHSQSIDVPAHPNLERVTVTPGGALTDYLSSKGMGLLSRQLARSGIVELVATTAPGLDDLLVLGRVKAFEKEQRADLIVIDGPAAGHAIDFVRAPAQLRKAIPSGPIGQQADEVIEMMTDPERVGIVVVTTPAFTPVAESIEIVEELTGTLAVSVPLVVVNKHEHESARFDTTGLDEALVRAQHHHQDKLAAQRQATEPLRSRITVPVIGVHRHQTDGVELIERLADELNGVDWP